ncbi:MAG: FtsX-like permease family protein [Mycobacteriales bacterium]
MRVALRLARRDARRARGRSILVVAMIGLPVLGLTTTDVLARTAQLSPSEQLTRELGAADASVVFSGGAPLEQDPSGHNSSSGPSREAPSEMELLGVLSPGSRLLPDPGAVSVQVLTADGLAIAQLHGLDYADPVVHGLVRQRSGRAPRTAGEVALSPRLARHLGLHVGDSMRTRRPERSYTVVGIAEDAYQVVNEAFVLPSALPASGERAGPPASYLVDAPQDVTWADVQRLNALGMTVRSRAVVLHPPPRSEVPYYRLPGAGSSVGTQVIAAGVLAVGMALLEVVLLAGPAFAVGARRRRRDLALVASAGGDGNDVRNIVLGGGVVLGSVAAVVGLTLGVGLAAALRPLLERASGTAMGHFDLRPWELLAVAATSVITGSVAAALPARVAARQDVVAALAGRRGVVINRKRVPILGLVIAVAGAVVAVLGVGSHGVAVILAGAVLGEIGLIMCTPTVLGMFGLLGRRLPLCPRMALRDAARNRASAAPAVAAVMAAVAGSVAIGVFAASLSRHNELSYHPLLARGDALVQLGDAAAREQAAVVAAALRRSLPARNVLVVYGQPEDSAAGGASSVEPPAPVQCPLALLTSPTEADLRRYARDPRCGGNPRYVGGSFPSILVDDGAVLPMLTGTPTREAVAALRAGKAVVFDSYLVADGRTTVRLLDYSKGDKGTAHVVPAVVQRDGLAPAQIVLPPATARQLGIAVAAVAVVADDMRVPTSKEEQAARGAIALLGSSSYLVVERGYESRTDAGLRAMVIGAGIITLGAAAIATALSNEDGRGDLTTLAAVGASPRVRRLLSMSRSGVIAGLGTALGVAAGFVPAVGLILAYRRVDRMASFPSGIADRPLVVPWSSLAITALVVPAIAVAVAGLFSRSRLSVERRAPR